MRVLVTGAGGFIGRRLVATRPADWDVVALSRQALADGPNLRAVRVEHLTGPLPAPVLEPFDAVIHLAGSSDHGLAVREPWRDLEATGVTAAALLGRITVRRIVALSSAAVYAGLEGQVQPDLPLAPPMAYALSKLYVEGLVHALTVSGQADSAAIFRLYNCFGPGERPTRLIPRVAEAIRMGDPFTLTGDGSSLSDPLFVDDVVRALVAAAASPASGVFDLCAGDARPLKERVRTIADVLGDAALPIVQAPRAGETPIRFWSDPKATLTAFGLVEWIPFRDAVRQYGRQVGWIG